MIINNINQQNIILILSMFYIYFLSDLFTIINDGPTLHLIVKLCIPIWGKLFIEIIKTFEKYNIDLHEWWHKVISTQLVVAYVLKFIHWIYDNSIHQCWDLMVKYFLQTIFSLIIFKIFYNFIFIFQLSYYYLFFSLLCTYGVYMRFDTSRNALATLSGKFIEMGTGIIISQQFKLIDEWKDYCLKNQNSWLSYVIKLIIGYHGHTDTDGETMAIEISNYVGVSYNDCTKLYKQSLVKKVSTVVDISKNMYESISTKFLSKKENIITITTAATITNATNAATAATITTAATATASN
jgi:hypothetical protein